MQPLPSFLLLSIRLLVYLCLYKLFYLILWSNDTPLLKTGGVICLLIKKMLIILNLSQGIIRPSSPMFCFNAYGIIENIIELSKEFKTCLVFNDRHAENDNEFKYSAPHMLENSIESARLDYIESKLHCPYLSSSYKRTMSPFTSEAAKKAVSFCSPKEITVVGFSLCFDVIPTALDLIAMGQTVKIEPSCTGDVSEQYLKTGMEFSQLLGLIK